MTEFNICLSAKDYAEAEYWLAKAFKLARGELWPTDIGECNLTLHEILAPQYSDILLKRAKLMMSDDIDNALALVHQAILVVCEGKLFSILFLQSKAFY